MAVAAISANAAAAANVERIRARISNDEILAQFTYGRKLTAGHRRLEPSGVDLAACAIASTVFRGEEGCVGLALPRGQHGLAAIVGAYLARLHEARNRPGSVAVLTRSRSLRETAATLRVRTERLGESMSVRRLGTALRPDGRVKPAAVSYQSTRDRGGMSQADHYLLFQLPHTSPPLAYNVISTSVVDAVSSSRDSWEQAFDRNHRARRRQVWIGEIGDPGFGAFCDQRQIPLFCFDWETIAACAAAFGHGTGPLTTSPLCASAGGPVGPAFQVCNHGRFTEELKELNWRLAEMWRKAKPDAGEEKPGPFRAAERLASFYGRVAFPVETFDIQTRFTYSVRSSAYLLRQVEEAYSSQFRGRHWKDAFNSHWGAVKGAAKALREIATTDCPKWWAVCYRVDAARSAGEKLRIVCQTQADQAALAQSLVDESIVPPSAIGNDIEIVTFSQRDSLGDALTDSVTLYLAPPPPWHASVYLTGERGRAEVLVYPTQVRQLQRAFAHTWQKATNHPANAALLSLVGFNGIEAASAFSAPPPLTELEQFSVDDTTTTDIDYATADGNDHVQAFVHEIVSLYGSDVNEDDVAAPRPERLPRAVAGAVPARRIVFEEGPMMIVADTASLDVVWSAGAKGSAKVVEMPVADLAVGNRVIVLPGFKRGSLLQELMAAWDARLGPVRFAYQSLWQDAIEIAVDKLGCAGLAARLHVTAGTVEDWLDPLRGARWPQQKEHTRQILEIARDRNEKAWENRASIIRYIERTRGAHRVIGRLLNRAVGEVVSGSDARWTRELERRVGQRLEDELAAAQFLTIKEVGAVEQLPSRVVGLFIDPDDASMKGTT